QPEPRCGREGSPVVATTRPIVPEGGLNYPLTDCRNTVWMESIESCRLAPRYEWFASSPADGEASLSRHPGVSRPAPVTAWGWGYSRGTACGRAGRIC